MIMPWIFSGLYKKFPNFETVRRGRSSLRTNKDITFQLTEDEAFEDEAFEDEDFETMATYGERRKRTNEEKEVQSMYRNLLPDFDQKMRERSMNGQGLSRNIRFID